MEKDGTMDLQTKLYDVLIIKGDIQIINQKNDLESFFILDVQKRYVKLVKEFLREDRQKMIRNQLVGHYLKELKIKLSKSKQPPKDLLDKS